MTKPRSTARSTRSARPDIPTALAQEYGFECHQRVYACPVSFADVPRSQPSFLEGWLGDG
ncbi:MAG TPA: hypothetical protein V6D02_06865 [Candidatus Obscuribacterales bacterium]